MLHHSAWHSDALLVEGLDALLKHGTIAGCHQGGGDLDHVVGADAKQVAVVGSMVKTTEGQAVGDFRATAFVLVRQDVGSFEQLRTWQVADAAPPVVCAKDDCPEGILVESLLGLDGLVAATDGCDLLLGLGAHVVLVHGDEALEASWIPAGDEDGPEWSVQARVDTVEVDEGSL